MTATELFSEERSAEVVAASFAGTADPRLREVMTSLVRHLHAFVKDVELTERGMGGGRSTSSPGPGRCATTYGRSSSCSPTCWASRCSSRRSTTGPAGRHRVHRARALPHGRVAAARARRRTSPWTARASRAWSPAGSPAPDGEPLAGATVDVWQANDDGFYDVQQPGVQPERNLRGLFTADDDGRVLVPLGRAPVLPDPGRRPGRRAAGGHRPAPQPAGAPALHRPARRAIAR